MYNSLEIIAILFIIVIQAVIAFRAYNQINQLNSFLPDGKSSLTLKEYEIPSEEILEIEPSQVIDRIAYLANYNKTTPQSSSNDIDESEDSSELEEYKDVIEYS